jgi:hypothetical protein
MHATRTYQEIAVAMKKAELDKQLGLKINGQRKGPEVAGRFSQVASGATDRREKRKLDAAAGLVPFACKLPSTLVAQLGERAATVEGGMTEMLTEMLTKALAK